jgi:hypothetical protein
MPLQLLHLPLRLLLLALCSRSALLLIARMRGSLPHHSRLALQPLSFVQQVLFWCAQSREGFGWLQRLQVMPPPPPAAASSFLSLFVLVKEVSHFNALGSAIRHQSHLIFFVGRATLLFLLLFLCSLCCLCVFSLSSLSQREGLVRRLLFPEMLGRHLPESLRQPLL